MLFNSIEFLIFFPIVTLLFFIIPHKYRWFMLLVSSCIFYMAFVPAYILILGCTIAVDYSVGIILNRINNEKKRIAFLTASILINVGFLFVFKYFNFFNANMTHLANWLHWNYPVKNLSLVLPIGLSFHTFQSMSYIIEIYRRKQEPERNFGIYALYVMFYPQLVAGPIERPQNMLHQFHEKHTFDSRKANEGMRLMLWGLLKKVVIADNLALVVDSVYKSPQSHTGITLAIATYFFAFQIYCDFSGYTDIARGAAKVIGFELMENFKRPYFSKSISEFWNRWHISLSSWFKDYVYIPLGGNRRGKWKWYRNLMIIFLLSGLWHGANWTYIIWGGLNGFYLVLSIWTRGIRSKISSVLGMDRFPILQKAFRVFITFNLISFSWIFFRANSLTDALTVIKKTFTSIRPRISFSTAGITRFNLVFCVLTICLLLIVQLLQRNRSENQVFERLPIPIRWGIYYTGVTILLVFGVFTKNSFIYFQF